jgi:hypothetical protein
MRIRTAPLLIALLPTQLNADNFRRFDNYCTTGAIVTCASVHITLVNMGPGFPPAIRVAVQNLDGTNPAVNANGYLWHDIRIQFNNDSKNGIDASIGGSTVGSVGVFGPDAPTWDHTADVGFVFMQGTEANQGIYGCTQVPWTVNDQPEQTYVTCPSQGYGGFAVITWFPLTQELVDWDLADADITWAFRNPNGGPGSTCVVGENCFSTVPEPMTMVLLATGLGGVGGAGIFRRRKKLG